MILAPLDNNDSFAVGIIIGSAVGACAIVVFGGVLVYFVRRTKKLKAKINSTDECIEKYVTRSLIYYNYSYVCMYVCIPCYIRM